MENELLTRLWTDRNGGRGKTIHRPLVELVERSMPLHPA